MKEGLIWCSGWWNDCKIKWFVSLNRNYEFFTFLIELKLWRPDFIVGSLPFYRCCVLRLRLWGITIKWEFFGSKLTNPFPNWILNLTRPICSKLELMSHSFRQLILHFLSSCYFSALRRIAAWALSPAVPPRKRTLLLRNLPPYLENLFFIILPTR